MLEYKRRMQIPFTYCTSTVLIFSAEESEPKNKIKKKVKVNEFYCFSKQKE